jgi:hypothetical protein
MAPENVRFFEGHKYMWDGAVYPSHEDAEAKREEYAGNGFETQIAEGGDEFLVYTRRVVTEVVVEGEAPMV